MAIVGEKKKKCLCVCCSHGGFDCRCANIVKRGYNWCRCDPCQEEIPENYMEKFPKRVRYVS